MGLAIMRGHSSNLGALTSALLLLQSSDIRKGLPIDYSALYISRRTIGPDRGQWTVFTNHAPGIQLVGNIHLPAPAGLDAPEGSEVTRTLNLFLKVAAPLLLPLPYSLSSYLDEQYG